MRTIVMLGIFTSGYIIVTWTLLDLNRLLLAKFLYRGEAPVEYVWSWHSKQVRKEWEAMRIVNRA